MNNTETVFIVDGDDASRERVSDLVQGMNLTYEAYSSAQDFLDSYCSDRPGCAILEVRIPDQSGLTLQEQLSEQAQSIPIIFHSSYASVPLVVRAIQNGAVSFLEKPAGEQELWEIIQQALQIDRRQRAKAAEQQNLQQQLGLLTEKELQVLELLAANASTRTIAQELGISIRTVEFRRARMLKKLNFETRMQLSHFALQSTSSISSAATPSVRGPKN